MSEQDGKYAAPEQISLYPMPNLTDPLKGGAFLLITQGGVTHRFAMNSTTMLRIASGISTVLIQNFAASVKHQKNQLNEAEIAKFVSELDNFDAISHKEEGSE